MTGIINCSGGEINCKLWSVAGDMCSQKYGPVSSLIMNGANQLSCPFNQSKTPLTTSLQEMCEKMNNIAHMEGGTIGVATMTGNQSLGAISVKSFDVGERKFDGPGSGR